MTLSLRVRIVKYRDTLCFDDIIQTFALLFLGGQARSRSKPRSWHPSPYVSEDEEDPAREERKAKIKVVLPHLAQPPYFPAAQIISYCT